LHKIILTTNLRKARLRFLSMAEGSDTLKITPEWNIQVIGILLLIFSVSIYAGESKKKKEKRKTQTGQTTLVFPPYLHSYGIQRATQSKLFLISKLSGFHTSFKNPQGIAVVRLEAWEDTTTEHDDDEVTVYGVNSGRHQILYNQSMYRLGVMGNRGPGINEFKNPHGIAANGKGVVYLCDTGNNRVVKLFNPGSQLIWQIEIGNQTQPDFNSPLNQPWDVALSSWGDLFVTDRGNDRIVVFDSLGRFLKEIGGLVSPTGITICDSLEKWQWLNNLPSHRRQLKLPGSRLYVIDKNGTRLQCLSLEGQVIHSVTVDSFNRDEENYQYLDCDYYGNVYCSHFKKSCLHKYSATLKFLEVYGRQGRGDKEFDQPRGIGIYRRYGQIFVAEKKGAQYYWVGTDVKKFNLSTHGNHYRAAVFLTEPSFVAVNLLVEGKPLTTLIHKAKKMSGFQNIVFTIPSQFKKQKENVTLQFVFEPTYSSYTYFWKKIIKQVPP